MWSSVGKGPSPVDGSNVHPSTSTPSEPGLKPKEVAAGMAAEMPAQYAGYNDNWSISAEKLLRDGRNILKVKRY